MSRKRALWIAASILGLALIGCAIVLIEKPYDPLDHISGVNVNYDTISIGRFGKGGPYIFSRNLDVLDSPVKSQQALAKILDAKPGWHYTRFNTKELGRYGTYMAMFKDTSYEITISYGNSGDTDSSILETRPATRGESFRASVKGFFKGLSLVDKH